jgi:polysaccharide biosynthesis/export protein
MKAANVFFASLLLAVLPALTGCGGLPSSGPIAQDIESQEVPDSSLGGYIVVDIDERVASITSSQPRDSFARVFHDTGPAPDLRVGVGDTVVVTIYEAGAGGLFSAGVNDKSATAGSRTAILPEQVVARDGTIAVPYAGRLKVAGMRPSSVEEAVVKALDGKAIQPQAVVTITKNYSNTATVGGEVVSANRVSLNPRGDRILDVIASAGGIKVGAHEAFIRLTRRNKTVSVGYNAILASPVENIYVLPDDVITVIRDPQTFTTFGATGRSEKVPFDTAGITLEEALAKAGGLLDNRADPGGIFMFRFEPSALVEQLVPGRPLPSAGNLVPIVYRLNLREANSFFLARSFPVKDKDILYIANSASDPVQKFLGLVGTVASPVISGAIVYGTYK